MPLVVEGGCSIADAFGLLVCCSATWRVTVSSVYLQFMVWFLVCCIALLVAGTLWTCTLWLVWFGLARVMLNWLLVDPGLQFLQTFITCLYLSTQNIFDAHEEFFLPFTLYFPLSWQTLDFFSLTAWIRLYCFTLPSVANYLSPQIH